jgi:hypothetical protein
LFKGAQTDAEVTLFLESHKEVNDGEFPFQTGGWECRSITDRISDMQYEVKMESRIDNGVRSVVSSISLPFANLIITTIVIISSSMYDA